MQLGAIILEAAQLAEKAGFKVVMNCAKIQYAHISGEIGWAGVNSGVLSSQKPVLKKRFQSFDIAAKRL